MCIRDSFNIGHTQDYTVEHIYDFGSDFGSIVYPVLLHPSNQYIIYVGTGGGGIYKTNNGGATWTPTMNGVADNIIYDLVMDPDNSNIVFAGTVGAGHEDSEMIYKTTNGGTSWSQKNSGLPQKKVYALAIQPDNGNILYTGTHGSGIYKTTNGGDSWFLSKNTTYEIHGINIYPTNPSIVFAGTNLGKIYKTTNSGTDWTEIDIPNQNSWIFDFTFDLSNSNIVYAATYEKGVYKSTNSGSNWTQVNSGIEDLNIYQIKMDESGRLYAGTSSQGIYISDNGGDSWSHLEDSGLLGAVNTHVLSEIDPYLSYVGSTDGLYSVIRISETVSTPTTPSGNSSGEVGDNLTYSTGGAVSSMGHSVEYCFDWGDGRNIRM